MGFLGVILPVIALLSINSLDLDFLGPLPISAWFIATLSSAVSITAVILIRKNQRMASFLMTPLYVALLFSIIITWPLQSMAKQNTQREIAKDIHTLPLKNEQVYLVGNRIASLLFYLTPEQRKNSRQGSIKEVSIEEFNNLTRLPPNTYCAINNKNLDLIQPQSITSTYPLKSIGHFQVLVELNSPPVIIATDSGEQSSLR